MLFKKKFYKKKNLYILVCGNLRYFKQNLETLNNYFKNSDYKFVFYPWLKEKDKINLFYNYNPKFNGTNFLKEKNWNKLLNKIKFSDNSNTPIINFFYMWDALIQSFNHLRHLLKDEDIILRFRTDIIIKSKNIPLNYDKIKDNEIYIPDCYHWNGVNDQIFFSNLKTLKRFRNFFYFVEKAILKNNFICSEFTFYKFLKYKKIKIKYFDLSYQLLRTKKNNTYNNIYKEKTFIPFYNKIEIKLLKIKYKFRNFVEFFIKKNKRNNKQDVTINYE